MHMADAQKLFWIGSPFFASALSACGWQVQHFNFEEYAVYGWEQLVDMAGWKPDVLVVADKSRPPFVVGMENFPCLTVFYCVDSHIHSYYPLYAQAFDVCLVSLKDHLPWFLGKNLPPERLWWFPPFAPDIASGSSTVAHNYLWDCLFVGTVNAETNPSRAHFMAELGQRLPSLHCMRGDYMQLFPQGRVLMNHSAAGDLNFRVFEALGCGGCLVTPDVGHGQDTLFTAGEHLLTYPQYDVEAAAAQVLDVLKQPHKQEALREAGLAAVNAGHRASHRAQEFTQKIQALYTIQGRECVAHRQQHAKSIRKLWLRMPYLLFAQNLTQPVLRQAYVEAAQGLFTKGIPS